MTTGRGWDAGGRRGKGNGLGNMRRRAEAMHGELTVESSAGKGTTVRLTVRLPVPASSAKLKGNGNGPRD